MGLRRRARLLVLPSISRLFDMLQDATAERADIVVVRFSDGDGHPTGLVVDSLQSQQGDKNYFRLPSR